MWKYMVTQKTFIHISSALLKKVPQNLKGKSPADQRWLVRQLNDPFVKAAHVQHYRCRSAFKLLEIDDKYSILRHGCSVVDCGAAPGAWSQVAVQRVNSDGTNQDSPCGVVIGIDLLRIAPLEGAHFLSCQDITDPATHVQLLSLLPDARADVILSDMAPNTSGHRELDHDRLVTMCLSLLVLAERVLRPGGSLVCKYWDGARAPLLQQSLSKVFQDVRTVKPRASRKDSAELYLLARRYRRR